MAVAQSCVVAEKERAPDLPSRGVALRKVVPAPRWTSFGD